MRGRLYILAAALLWSIGGVFLKKLTGPLGVPPVTVACLRSLAAGLALSWALPRVRRRLNWRVPASALAYALMLGSFVTATAGTTSANAIFLQYAFPLLVAAGAWVFFKERIRPRTGLALGVGMGGVAVILIGSWQPGVNLGLVCGVTSAVALAMFVLLQRGVPDASPLGLTSLYNLATAVILLPFAWRHLHIPTTGALMLVFLGVVQLGLPYVLFIAGLRRVQAAEAGLICLAEPVLNPLWVWIFIGETPAVSTFIGAGLILVALAVRYAGARRPPVPSPD